jgi:hypothetical protein
VQADLFKAQHEYAKNAGDWTRDAVMIKAVTITLIH